MKNLKMFAFAVMAFAVMAMGVHATGENPSCLLQGEDGYDNGTKCVATLKATGQSGFTRYTDFASALTTAETNGGTVTILTDISTAASNLGSSIASALTIAKPVTIELGTYTLDLDSNGLTINNGGSLTINGTGKVLTSAATAFTVSKGGSLTTSGALALSTSASSTGVLIDASGNVTIGEGAILNATGTIVKISAHNIKVDLNAKVGTEEVPVSAKIVDVNSGLTAPVLQETYAKVNVKGGSYYTSADAFTVAENITLTMDDGIVVSTAGTPVYVGKGSATLNGGNITAKASYKKAVEVKTAVAGDKANLTVNGATLTSEKHYAIIVSGPGSGDIKIQKGTIVSKTSEAVAFYSKDVTMSISGGTLEGGNDKPAIYIDNSLLTGMATNGAKDNFKGILTGGKYLNKIVGNAGDDYTAEEVAKYLIAEGLEEKTEGNYKILGNGAGDTPEGEPGTTEPGETGDGNQGPEGNVPNPNTNDNILVYAGLGLVSLTSVAFTARKRED